MDINVLILGLILGIVIILFIFGLIIVFQGFSRKRKAPPLSKKDSFIHLKYSFAYSVLYVLLAYAFFFGIGLFVILFSFLSGFPVTDGGKENLLLFTEIVLSILMLIPFYYLMKAALRAVDKEATFLNRKNVCVYFLTFSYFFGWMVGIFLLLLTNTFTLDHVTDVFKIGFIPLLIAIHLSRKYKPLNR